MLQEKCFPASTLEILSYARKTKIPSRVLSLVNKQANKQTKKDSDEMDTGGNFLRVSEEDPRAGSC